MTAIACDPTAIGDGDRARYIALVARLRGGIRDRAEVEHGYVFTLAGDAVTLPEIAEWMSLERRCCPFLRFQLSASGDRDEWALELTGPEGVKAIIGTAFVMG